MAGTPERILWIDAARTAALAGMIVFHFVTDLALFGLIPPETPVTGGWAVFSRLVAGSFLFLAGVSLILAHGRGLRWGPFLRRLGVIAAAAGLVTAGTYIAVPDRFVYFGILHAIALASVLGLAFLRAPVALTLATAAFAFAAPDLFRHPVFNAPWLWWLGLSTEIRPTIDFEPVLPWCAPCLLGIAAGRLAGRWNLWAPLGGRGAVLARVGWPGRHSLAIYLIHQLVLIAAIWAGMWVTGR